ncbi:MAG TPA: hypothetical protein ENO23_02810 [Alphaproteobacteria bacterium]|nr:hypothetical protein [Alphaproteobacteria bacterium]
MRTRAIRGRARGLLPGMLAALAAGACANPEPARQLVDQLVANEQLQFEARSRDFDAALETAQDAVAYAVEACERVADARIRRLETEIDRTALALRAEFETRAWKLQWDAYPRAAEARLASVSAAADAAGREVATLREQAAAHPNDVRLQQAFAVAEQRAADRQRVRLDEELRGAYALARRIETARRAVGQEIADTLAPLRARVRKLEGDACIEPDAVDLQAVSERRAAYARLNVAQIEGLTMLRAHIERPSVARLVVAGAGEALRGKLAAVVPESLLSPLFERGIGELEAGVDRAERTLRDAIEREIDALRDAATGSS